MVKSAKLLIILLTVLMIFAIAYFFWLAESKVDLNSVNSPNLNNNTTINSMTSMIISENESTALPTKEAIISSINWSKYPLIGYHYISNLYVDEPNEVITHSFTYASTEVGITNPDDVPEVYKELSSLVKAERMILGPNSAPEIWGHVGDYVFHVGMMPYSTNIYRRDYVHPIHDLTFSDIDASEVD